ncbi:MAG: sigma-70 family RNA polymerase sigma factor [Clostridia bacterium]|nr:sigma-70 family RNA polymerase sigma factor [Clostridia bacterium]
MNDTEIIRLYWTRSERAVAETRAKYGAYCLTIARNILGDAQDAEEAAADACMAAWNTIPPKRPAMLRSYLGKLTRNLALKKWREKHALKRGGGETALALDELAECIPGENDVEREVDRRLLSESVNRFLAGLKDDERRVFVCRYWNLDSVEDVSRRFGFSQSKVKSMLMRLRGRLRAHLEREGFFDEN